MALMRAISIIIITGLFFAQSMLVMQVSGFLSNGADPGDISQSDILFNVFGQLREIISSALFIKADEYYHGGTKHPFPGDNCMMYKDGGLKEKESFHKDIAGKLPQRTNFISRINAAISYQPLKHLDGGQNKEVIPWFYLAARFDPHNVQAYVVGGYWLSSYLDKPDEALKFLNEGIKNNPRSWVIYREIGDLYFLIKKDYPQAIRNLRLAYLFMDKKTPDVFQQRHLLTFLAAAYEKEGDLRQAVHYYESLKKVFENDSQLAVKIETLKKQLRTK